MILEKTALSTAYFMVVPVRKHWPSQLQKGECILLRKLLQFLLLESYGWIVYIWSSSTSLQSLTCLGHLGKKHAVNLYTSPCFRGLCVFSSKFSGSECEKKHESVQNPQGTSVCCHDETNWPPHPSFRKCVQFTNFQEVKNSPTQIVCCSWYLQLRSAKVLHSEKDEKQKPYVFVFAKMLGLPIFNNVSS